MFHTAERETVKLTPFELSRTAQAAAILLKHSPGERMTRMRLIKLLYIADRESLKTAGRSITGDKHVAMQHGPVLSYTLNLINGSHYQTKRWEQFFASEGQIVVMHDDPGDGRLSNFEVELITSVAKKFKNYSAAQLRNFTHKFPEYEKNEPQGETKVKDIPLADVLEALGQSDRKGKLEAEAAQVESARRLFSAYAR